MVEHCEPATEEKGAAPSETAVLGLFGLLACLLSKVQLAVVPIFEELVEKFVLRATDPVFKINSAELFVAQFSFQGLVGNRLHPGGRLLSAFSGRFLPGRCVQTQHGSEPVGNPHLLGAPTVGPGQHTVIVFPRVLD